MAGFGAERSTSLRETWGRSCPKRDLQGAIGERRTPGRIWRYRSANLKAMIASGKLNITSGWDHHLGREDTDAADEVPRNYRVSCSYDVSRVERPRAAAAAA